MYIEKETIENIKDIDDFVNDILPEDEYDFYTVEYGLFTSKEYTIINNDGEIIDKIKFPSFDEVQTMLYYMSIEDIIQQEKKQLLNKLQNYILIKKFKNYLKIK